MKEPSITRQRIEVAADAKASAVLSTKTCWSFAFALATSLK